MKKRAWALALAFLLVLTGCGKKEEPVPDPEPPAAEEPIVTPEPEAEPEPAVPAGMNPLTGLPMEPEYERNRPVAVMLNNMIFRITKIFVFILTFLVRRWLTDCVVLM